MRDMTRAEAIEILNLEPETALTFYSWPTGQLVMHARKALRPRLPSLESLAADEQAALAFVKLADAVEARRLNKQAALQSRRASDMICDEDVARTLAITTRPPRKGTR